MTGTGEDRFRQALAVVLAHEGGFVDDPDDPGGATKYGISLRWLASLGEAGDLDGDGDTDGGDIAVLDPHDAARLYHARWWEPHGYGRYPDPGVATKTFDLAVNMGPVPAHRVLQRAIRAVSGRTLAEDGLVGPATREAMAACDGTTLLAAMKAEAAGHYRLIAATRPRLAKFLRGWLNRAYS